MSPVEAAWVGAIIEGEGSIVVRFNKGVYDGVSLTVANTVDETLNRCSAYTGTGRVYEQSPRSKEMQLGTKRVRYWVVARRREVRDILRQVIPHLTGKAEKANRVLQRIDLELAGAH